MANFDRLRPPGQWITASVVTAAEFEAFDAIRPKLINTEDGSIHAPSNPIIIGGAGMQLTGPLSAIDVDEINVVEGGFITINPGAWIDVEGDGPGGSPAAGVIHLNAGNTTGGALIAHNGATITMESGSALTQEAGSTWTLEGDTTYNGVTLNLSGGTTVNLNNLGVFQTFAGSSVALGGSATISGTGALTCQSGGAITLDSGATLTCNGPAVLNNTISCGALSTLTCNGAVNLSSTSVTTRSGPQLRSGDLAYEAVRIMDGANEITATGSIDPWRAEIWEVRGALAGPASVTLNAPPSNRKVKVRFFRKIVGNNISGATLVDGPSATNLVTLNTGTDSFGFVDLVFNDTNWKVTGAAGQVTVL